ncbi:MAG TPA: creatininase family protein [Dongiaceae bacterium]
MSHGVWLETLSWVEAKSRFDAGAVVLMPIGAIAKEHGPHLPLNTDWLIARALAQRVAEALPIVVAPVVSAGYYPAFTDYAGSQHLSAATFIAVIEQLIGNLIGQGARRIALLNTGVSTEAPLRIACRNILDQHGISIPCADIRNLGRGSEKLLQQQAGGHADEAETSIMLALDPARVDLRHAVSDYGDALTRSAGIRPNAFQRPGTMEGSRSGAFGDPTLATAAKGKAILDAMVNELVAGLRASYPEALAAGRN